ncbi:MAG: small subunit ribosomal protein S24e [Archaeoglobaceae archaeon]|nr:small subunit ribosomal protein S24e [Archaeoglobaceae archaeon]MDK2876001.1 small subunit ribosomal protein S24e [Archaeoglobaceae archaeon]
MEIKVESERSNPLLKRRELHLRVSFNGKTPSRAEIREKVAGMMNAEPSRVVLDYIKNEFGKREARIYAKIYDSEKDMKEIEDRHILERNFPELKAEKKEEVAKQEG